MAEIIINMINMIWLMVKLTNLLLQLTSMNMKTDVDFLQVWGGGPSLTKSRLLLQLTGVVNDKWIYGFDNFIILRVIMDTTFHESNKELSFQWMTGRSERIRMFFINY